MKNPGRCLICGSVKIKEVVYLAGNKKVYSCNNCGNAFTYPKPQVPNYAMLDFHSGDRIKENQQLTSILNLPDEVQYSYKVQKELIGKYLKKGSEILEVGGGEGIFLECLKNDYRVELIEPSKSAALRAEKRGIKVYNELLHKVSLEKRYDVLCMSHVLEHIDNPLETIEYLKEKVNPRGYILLTQTNFKGFMPRLLKEKWYAWVPDHHFWHFSLKGMKFLAGNAKLKVVDYKYSRLWHGKSIYHESMKYFPFLQDQFHVLLKK